MYYIETISKEKYIKLINRFNSRKKTQKLERLLTVLVNDSDVDVCPCGNWFHVDDKAESKFIKPFNKSMTKIDLDGYCSFECKEFFQALF